MGGGVRVGHETRHLFHVEHFIGPGIEGEDIVFTPLDSIVEVAEVGDGRIAALDLAAAEIERPTVEATGGTGFEAFDGEAEVLKAVADGGAGIAHAPSFFVAEADVHESAHKGTRAEHDRLGTELHTEAGGDAGDLVVFDEE